MRTVWNLCSILLATEGYKWEKGQLGRIQVSNAILQLISIQFNSIHTYQLPTMYLALHLVLGTNETPLPALKDLTVSSDQPRR